MHRFALFILCLLGAFSPLSVSAQPRPSAAPPAPAAAPSPAAGVPAARAANNVAVITIHDEIDRWTARSVARRIQEATQSGADALVFDIDTPGGEMGAMLAIAAAIKGAPVGNTVAWVHPTAYSAGAVIALACREIVVTDRSVLGDALPIEINLLGMLHPIPDAEREKIVGPVLAEVIDSARKNGYDEVLVQGFVRRGVELWLVEHRTTGQRLFVTAAQYEQAVGTPPTRTQPTVGSVTGPTTADRQPLGGTDATTAEKPGGEDGMEFVPGAPNVAPRLAAEVGEKLALLGRRTARPDLSDPAHAGAYKTLEYVSDGYGILTFHAPELLRYRLASGTVNSEADLKTFFGAQNTARLDENWAEVSARVLSMLPVRAVLLVIFLVALFVEMTHPGVILPGAVAAVALIALVLPQVLLSLAAWWMVAAVLAGILLVLLEVFILPGFGVAGVLGVILLFGGLVGLFIGGTGTLFPGRGGPAGSGEGTYALATLIISFLAAVGVIFLIWRTLPSLPILSRLVLRDDRDDARDTLLAAMGPEGALAKGARGVALTSLRPAGRARFGDAIHEVFADVGFIDAGTSVVVVRSDEFRTTVHAAKNQESPPAAGGAEGA